MDLESLEDSISLIKRLIDADSTIKYLSDQLKSKDEQLQSLEQKLKAYTSNTQLKSYISNLESTVQSLQQKVEQLQIQISESKSKPEDSDMSSSSKPKQEPTFPQLLHTNEVWSVFSSFLSEEDYFKLLLCFNLEKSKILPNLSSFINQVKPLNSALLAPQITEKQEIIENKEIRGLLKQDHYFELNLKPIEEKLVNVMKTLLVMQKTTDILTSVSMPTEKYSSIEELVVNRFTPDKTAQLLGRSASYLASNPNKMANWVVFVDNSLASLLYESAKLLQDGRIVDNLKKDLVEKLKVAEEALINVEFERKDLEEQLETEKNLKIHLAQRLKKVELENSKRGSEIIKLREALQQSELEKIHNMKKIENLTLEFDSHRKIMASEILRLRSQVKVVGTQKSEILEAFSEISQILNSLSFD